MAKSMVSAVAILLMSGATAWAKAPPQELVDQLTRVIRAHCPDAEIEVSDEHGFVAKQGTMLFTVHGIAKNGEISPDTHQEEGPNFKGFLLRVQLREGPPMTAAVVPQTLKRPYFATYIDAPPTEKEDQHFAVSFAYGGRVDEKLKKAIFAAIPRTKFRGAKPPTEPATPASGPEK